MGHKYESWMKSCFYLSLLLKLRATVLVRRTSKHLKKLNMFVDSSFSISSLSSISEFWLNKNQEMIIGVGQDKAGVGVGVGVG